VLVNGVLEARRFLVFDMARTWGTQLSSGIALVSSGTTGGGYLRGCYFGSPWHIGADVFSSLRRCTQQIIFKGMCCI
jgi:hypothetical protein